MPHRTRAMMSPIADNGERRTRFAQRKVMLVEKAERLESLSGVPVAVACSGLDGVGDTEYWPSKERVTAVADQFSRLPKNDRHHHQWLNQADCVAGSRGEQSSKMNEVREGGIIAATAFGAWDRALDSLPDVALKALLRSTHNSLVATQGRIRALLPQQDESAGENLVVTGEDDESSAVVQRLRRRGISVSVDEAQWMCQLVEDLKEKEKPAEPANGNAAPHSAYEHTQYVNVDGYVMERDAFDFIRYDLGMPPPPPPPSIERPESPVYGEPLQLWSWDDSSFPQSGPPPSKQARTC